MDAVRECVLKNVSKSDMFQIVESSGIKRRRCHSHRSCIQHSNKIKELIKFLETAPFLRQWFVCVLLLLVLRVKAQFVNWRDGVKYRFSPEKLHQVN